MDKPLHVSHQLGKRMSLDGNVGKLFRPRELRSKAQTNQRFSELKCAAKQPTPHEETRQRAEETKGLRTSETR